MGWIDLLGVAQQANTKSKSLGKQRVKAKPQMSHGVGPWARRQGQVPQSFLERFVAGGDGFQARGHARAKPKPEPKPIDTRRKTSAAAQAIGGKRGNKREGEAIDKGIEGGAQSLETGKGAFDAYNVAAAEGKAAADAYQQAATFSEAAALKLEVADGAFQSSKGAADITQQVAQAKKAAEAAAAAKEAAEGTKAAADGIQSVEGYNPSWETAVILQVINAGVQGMGQVEQFNKTAPDKRKAGDTRETAFHRGVWESDPFAKITKPFVKGQDRIARDVSKYLKKVF